MSAARRWRIALGAPAIVYAASTSGYSPTAASLQIVWREYRDYRREVLTKPIDAGGSGLAPPPDEPPTPRLATP